MVRTLLALLALSSFALAQIPHIKKGAPVPMSGPMITGIVLLGDTFTAIPPPGPVCPGCRASKAEIASPDGTDFGDYTTDTGQTVFLGNYGAWRSSNPAGTVAADITLTRIVVDTTPGECQLDIHGACVIAAKKCSHTATFTFKLDLTAGANPGNLTFGGITAAPTGTNPYYYDIVLPTVSPNCGALPIGYPWSDVATSGTWRSVTTSTMPDALWPPIPMANQGDKHLDVACEPCGQIS